MSAESSANDDPWVPTPCRIRAVRGDTADVFTWELEPPAGSLPFRPGQFNMLYVHGAGEVPISISGSPSHPERLVHTIRSVGRVTRLCAGLRAGDMVGVRGPFGSEWPLEAARGGDVVLVAGGIGLAPLRPVIYEVLTNRRDFRRLWIVYGARTPADMLYPQEALAWGTLDGVEVFITVDRAGPEWVGPVGVVTGLLHRVELDPANTQAFICGPEVMMRFVARDLIGRGLPADRIAVSMERNMHCAVGTCGHCQLGPEFICKDGPVFPYPRVAPLMGVREL